MNELALDTKLALRGITTDETSLTFEHKMSPKLWDVVLTTVTVHGNAVQWWKGDVLLAGDGWFNADMYQYIDGRIGSQSTVNNLMRVCRIFGPERRDKRLSFSHYTVAAGLKETEVQDRFLALAIEKGWDRDTFANVVKEHKEELAGPTSARITRTAEDAELISDPKAPKLPREPQTINGTAEETPESAPEESFDRVADMQAIWAETSPAEQVAFWKWSTERLQLLLSDEQKAEAQNIIEQIDLDQDIETQFQANAGDDIEQGSASPPAPDSRSEAPDEIEPVSRVDVGRTASATSETMDETARRDEQLDKIPDTLRRGPDNELLIPLNEANKETTP